MKKYFSKIVLIVCGLLVWIAFIILAIISEKRSTMAYDEYGKFLLGKCYNYGIVCNELHLTSDVETNFCTGVYGGNVDIGNTIAEDKASFAGEIRVGEVLENLQWNQVRHNAKVYVDETVKEVVAELLEEKKEQTVAIVDREDDTVLPKQFDQNSFVVDVSDKQENIVYVNADKIFCNDLQNGALKLIARKNQSVVFNSHSTDYFTIPRYTVQKDGTKSEIAKSVIWNLPYVNNLQFNSDGIKATVLAPNAFVNINTTAEGWLVCDTIVSNTGEWHMISREEEIVATSTPVSTATPNKELVKGETAQPTSTSTAKNEKVDAVVATPTAKTEVEGIVATCTPLVVSCASIEAQKVEATRSPNPTKSKSENKVLTVDDQTSKVCKNNGKTANIKNNKVPTSNKVSKSKKKSSETEKNINAVPDTGDDALAPLNVVSIMAIAFTGIVLYLYKDFLK